MQKTTVHLKPVTPGELLRKEFLIPMGLAPYRVARAIGVSADRMREIVAGQRGITTDTDLRLCRYLGLSNGYWLRAQAAYNAKVAAPELAGTLRRIKPWAGTAAQFVAHAGTVRRN